MHGQLSRIDVQLSRLTDRQVEQVSKYLLRGYSAERTAELTGLSVVAIRELKKGL